MAHLVTPEETYKHLLHWSLFDVRSHEAYNQRHIQGAQWLDVETAVDFARQKLEKNEKFVLYDQGEGDTTAEFVAASLEDEGYTGVSVLEGGYTAWQRHHYPSKSLLERSVPPRKSHIP